MGNCVKGNILYFDYSNNEFKSKDEVYSDKYEFLKDFLINFWNEKYRWKEVNINTKRNVIVMKGDKLW